MIKQQGGIPRYQATFKLSQRRAWYQRLTPLAWFCAFLGGLGFAAVLITVMNVWVNSRNGMAVLSSQQVVQAAAQPRVMPTQSPAKFVIVARPTARPAVVVAAPKPANGNVSAVVTTNQAASQNYDTANADVLASASTAGNTGKRGAGMSPIVFEVQRYYNTIRKLPMDVYMFERDGILQSFFHGNGLTAAKAEEAKRETYDYIKTGDVEVRVVSVKGQTAIVSIKQKNWVKDVYDVKTGEVKEADVKKENVEQTMRMVYDPTFSRWKFAEYFAPAAADAPTDVAAAVATPIAKPAVKPAAKKVVKPVATAVVQVSP